MLKSFFTRASVALALAAGTAFAASAAEEGAASGAHATIELPEMHWSFEGVFGSYDRSALQRGFQVYKEVCSTCHALSLIAIRDLNELGYSADEVKAFAATYEMTDGPNDEGEMFTRPGLPSDYFPSPYPNEAAARYAFNGAYPPDLSLMAKAREGGPTYIHALLTGYRDPPADAEVIDGKSYNLYFPTHWISMPPPLSDGQVTYADGTVASVDQMSSDVAHFLMWAAEPKLDVRKQTGVKVMLFLLVLTGLLYAAKRKVWADLH